MDRAERKRDVVAQILAALEAELEAASRAAQATYAGAIDEENKAENQYDTRAIEASYLAGAQARRAGELREMITRYRNLSVRVFGDDDAVAVTAMVKLEGESRSAWYFIGPIGGGIKVHSQGEPVVVVTPSAPLGRAVLGKEIGDTVTVGRDREYEIADLM